MSSVELLLMHNAQYMMHDLERNEEREKWRSVLIHRVIFCRLHLLNKLYIR